MTTIELTPPCDFINANDRAHFMTRAKLTNLWRTSGFVHGLKVKARPDRAHITVGIRFPTNHRRDVGNYYPTAKAILDGLVDAGVLEDDDDTRVVGPDMRRIRPNGTPLVRITITPLEESS